MHKRELAAKLDAYSDDDIVGIGVRMEDGSWKSTAIAGFGEGSGILLLYTPEGDAYRAAGEAK